MRFLILVTSILLIPILVIAHLWIYDEDLKPALANRALGELRQSGIKRASVKLDYLDATIYGTALDVEMREKAAGAMRKLSGIHFDEARNLIVVPARVEAQLSGSQLSLSGWLPDEKSVQALLKIVGDFRPDLTVEARTLRISPYVSTGIDDPEEITPRHRFVRPILARLRVPPSFSIEKSDGTYFVKGALPSALLKQGVIDAVQDNPRAWPVDTSGLVGAPYVEEAAYTQSNALPLFLKSYFESPVPGTFSINEDGSPRIVADATREMEAEWLALLRGVSGAAKVDAELTIYPSEYQIPGYRPMSQVEDGTLAPLVDELRETAIRFDPTSNSILLDEEMKLASLQPLIAACGPGLSLVLSGTGGADTDGSTAHRARCEEVKTRLIALGMSRSQIEVLDLGPFHARPPTETDPLKQSSARVEMLVK